MLHGSAATRLTLAPGVAALGFIVALVGTGLGGLLAASGPVPAALPWDEVLPILRFTLVQATLSTVLSLAGGALIALALARRPAFPGRGVFIAALNLASVLPAVVAVFGIVAVLGRSGWLAEALAALGLDADFSLYGLPGILVAHVFFNMPLAARIYLGALAATPGEHWRLAAQLGMQPATIARLIDRPVLMRETPALAALIFLLCFTSFAIVLTLGGGPGAATLEVAIYEAVRFDVDFARAGLLALLQVVLCLALALPIVLAGRRPAETGETGLPSMRPDAASAPVRTLDAVVLAATALLLLPPLAAVAVSGMAGLTSLLQADVATATITSVLIALPAACIALALALAVAGSARALRSSGYPRAAALMVLPAGMVIAAPPLAVSAGLFVALRNHDPFSLAAPLIIAVNALMALPFVLRQVEPPLSLSAERYGRLAESLGLYGLKRVRLVDWPLLRRPLLAALAVATALSFGDLGVAAFFGSGRLTTLPLLLYERMGAYRMAESASVALLLALIVLALFLAAQKLSGEALARSR